MFDELLRGSRVRLSPSKAATPRVGVLTWRVCAPQGQTQRNICALYVHINPSTLGSFGLQSDLAFQGVVTCKHAH